jgi:hypothetical protein
MDQETKDKHSKRIQQKENHIRKQVRIAETYGLPVTEPHKLAKKHSMNCGDPKCSLCGNPRKVYKERTIKELSFDQTKEWTSD